VEFSNQLALFEGEKLLTRRKEEFPLEGESPPDKMATIFAAVPPAL